jgi:predicted amidohydrolase
MLNQSSIKVAAAQIESVYGDIESNLEKHLACIAEAHSAGVDLLVFPELSLVGHSAGRDALELALDRHHPVISRIAAASAGMHTVFGFIEEAAGVQFYNSVATVREGVTVHLHRKINLATYGRLDDGKYYAPGDELTCFDLDHVWNVGTPICADLWNPALVHALACSGATLLAAPISSAFEAVGEGFDNPAGWDINSRFHSMTYGCPIILANRIGKEGQLNFWGGSKILDAFGKVLAAATELREQLVTADLDYATVRRARFLLPTARDANSTVLRQSSKGYPDA